MSPKQSKYLTVGQNKAEIDDSMLDGITGLSRIEADKQLGTFDKSIALTSKDGITNGRTSAS